jgi:RNA polymerase sporulation-specific sigma factor
MLSTTFMLLVSSAMTMLRMGDNSSSFPRPLKAQEEQECIQRMLTGDMEARNTLIEHNLRLVMHIIKKYYTTAADGEDLVSIGTIGLIKGVSTYRPDKGVRLATYASRCIENAIRSPMGFQVPKRSPMAQSVLAGRCLHSFRRITSSCISTRMALYAMRPCASTPSA